MPFEESPKAAEQAEDDTQVHAVHAENSSQVQLLKDLLLQQTRRSEQLGKQAAARDWERWELLQLLRQKDEQLEFEETAAAKQRVVLNGARAGARHYRAVCCLRAWRSHVQQLCAERALLRAKNKQAVARLRHAGSLLHMVLKHVLNRQLKSGMNQLWLHATAMLAVPEALAEKRKDESGFFTPRRNIGTLQRIASPSWDASPLMRVAASEVSTEIPSRDGGLRSSSSSGWQGASVDPVTRLFKPDAVAAARLVIHLQSMLAQRLFWSVGEWKRHRSKAQEASRLEEQQRLQNRFIWEQHAAEQAALQAEHSELLISLEAAESSQEVAAQQAANKVRKSLLEAWGRDRGKWAQERAKLTAAAERAEEEAKLALLAAQSAEADARCAMEAEKVARAKLQGEENVCTQLAAELRERIKQAESIEADLEWRLQDAKAQAAAPSSPELQELDSYAELVERLRSEVAHERAERQASAKSLSALRSSYRLLLQRTSADGRDGVRGLRESLRGECRSMPTSFVVH